MFCSKCKHQMYDSDFFCSNCGTYNIADDIYIPFSDAMLSYICIRAPYEVAAKEMRRQFTKFAEQITSFDNLYSTGYDLFKTCMLGWIEDGVLGNLIAEGVDTYNVQILAKEFAHYSIGGSGDEAMRNFLKISELYQQCVSDINTKRDIQRANRSHWQGGGFGLKGALSGALTAGILNLGTEAIRGIGDAFTDSGDKKYVDSFMQKYFPTAKKSLIDALYFYICDMATFVYNILVKERIYSQVEFAKCDEVYITDEKTISDKVQTIANNILKGYQNHQYTKEKAIDKLCQCITEYPFNYDPYGILYKIERSTKDGLIALGAVCGMENTIKRLIYLVDNGKIYSNP